MKKILLTSNLYLPNIGGIENSIRHLAHSGLKKGDSVLVVTSNIVDGGEYILAGEAIEQGVRVCRYKVDRKKNKLTRMISHIHSAVSVYRKHKDSNTIVIARYHWSVLFCFLSGYRDIRYLVPGIVKNQNDKKNLAKKNNLCIFLFESYIQRLALRVSKKVFVFSFNMENQVRDVYPSCHLYRVNPGVDTVRFSLKENTSIGNVKLIAVCRLVKAKGIEYAIESLKYLNKNYSLTIIGDGEDLAELRLLTKKLDLEKRVIFEGKKNNPEHFLLESDIFLLPSLYEPFGQTILEASATGLPTVAFQSDLVETATFEILGELGTYASELTSLSYALAIEEAVKNMSNEKSIKLRELVTKNYSWEILYENVTVV